MGIPLVAVGAGVSGIIKGAEAKRVESHINDRMARFAGYSDEYLQYITTLGGETAEAARRVLGTRAGRPAQAPQSGGQTVTERITGVTGNNTGTLIAIGVFVVMIVLLKRK